MGIDPRAQSRALEKKLIQNLNSMKYLKIMTINAKNWTNMNKTMFNDLAQPQLVFSFLTGSITSSPPSWAEAGTKLDKKT